MSFATKIFAIGTATVVNASLAIQAQQAGATYGSLALTSIAGVWAYIMVDTLAENFDVTDVTNTK